MFRIVISLLYFLPFFSQLLCLLGPTVVTVVRLAESDLDPCGVETPRLASVSVFSNWVSGLKRIRLVTFFQLGSVSRSVQIRFCIEQRVVSKSCSGSFSSFDPCVNTDCLYQYRPPYASFSCSCLLFTFILLVATFLGPKREVTA